MALMPGLCVEGKLALLRGDMRPEDVYMVALYGADAVLDVFTAQYTPAGEVRGQGYIAGGAQLKGIKYGIDGIAAMMTWSENPVWRNATINARGALIYNKTRDNTALTVIDFRRDVISTNGNWTLPIPPATAKTAVVRLI